MEIKFQNLLSKSYMVYILGGILFLMSIGLGFFIGARIWH
jgi:Tfp pilus assembly protein PilZ